MLTEHSSMPFGAVPAAPRPAATPFGRAGSAAAELSSLSAHFAECKGCKGRWFSIRCTIEAIDSFVAPRFVTSVLLIGAVVGIGAFVL